MEDGQINETAREPTKKERKDARKSLLSLLKRLRRACSRINQVSDWYDVVNDVQAVLHQHGNSIPAAQRRRIKDALLLPEATLAAAGRACQVLQIEVEKTAMAIAVPSAVASVVLKTVLVTMLLAAAVVFVAPLIADQIAVDVHIFNEGCDPFNLGDVSLPDTAFLPLADLILPSEVIHSGGDRVISVPPLPLEVDNITDPNILFIGFPAPVPDIPIPVRGATNIRFNEQPLLGERQTINLADLRGADEHVLVVRCE